MSVGYPFHDGDAALTGTPRANVCVFAYSCKEASYASACRRLYSIRWAIYLLCSYYYRILIYVFQTPNSFFMACIITKFYKSVSQFLDSSSGSKYVFTHPSGGSARSQPLVIFTKLILFIAFFFLHPSL